VQQGWINTDGTQQSITLIRFAIPAGATSTFDDLSSAWKDKPKPVTMVTDPAIGAVGWSDPAMDALGNTEVELAVAVGDIVIRVQEYAAVTPDPADAKVLLQKQYDVLKNGS
jgi:hypothetical protein